MAGLDKILGEIRKESEAAAAQIVDAAKKEAAQIRYEAEREAKESADRYGREAKKREEDREARAVSAAALKKRQLLLEEKQRLITGVLEKARTKLLELPEAEYFDAMLRMAERNVLPQAGEIRFNSRDLNRLPKDFGSRLEALALKKGGRLAVSKEPVDIEGGFVMVYEGIEQNCSISALFETNAEELADEIQKLLF